MLTVVVGAFDINVSIYRNRINAEIRKNKKIIRIIKIRRCHISADETIDISTKIQLKWM